MYSECVRCQKLGHECDGPNFLAMPPHEQIAWCKERKKHMGLTNAKLAEMSDLPQGTVDSLLANTHADFKVGTIQKLLRVLVGGKWLGDPCADPTGAAAAELKEKNRALELEIQHKDKTIQHYEAELDELKTLVRNNNKRHSETQKFLQDQIRFRNRLIAVIGPLLLIAIAVIIGALVVDRLNPDKGFFWLSQILNRSSLGRPLA